MKLESSVQRAISNKKQEIKTLYSLFLNKYNNWGGVQLCVLGTLWLYKSWKG